MLVKGATDQHAPFEMTRMSGFIDFFAKIVFAHDSGNDFLSNDGLTWLLTKCRAFVAVWGKVDYESAAFEAYQMSQSTKRENI